MANKLIYEDTALNDSLVNIDDSEVSGEKTYSSSKIESVIASAITSIIYISNGILYINVE